MSSNGFQETLKDSDGLYRTLFENTDDPFQLVEPLFDKTGKPYDFRFLSINKAYEIKLGVRAVDVIGKTAKEVFPNLEPYWIDMYSEVLKLGKPMHYENYNEDTNLWFDLFYFPYGKGTVAVLFRDITQRKKTEEELARAASFPKLNPYPIVEISFDGKISYANPATDEKFPSLKTLGQSHPFLSDWQNVIKVFEGKSTGTFKREVKVDENWYYQVLFLVPNRLLIRIYSVDITERKQAEESLKEAQAKLQEYTIHLKELVEERTQKIKQSEQSYRELYESFDEAFLATDWEFNVIHWNKAAERVTTIPAKDALGKKIYDVLPEMLSVNITPYFDSLKERKPARFTMNSISRETGRPSVFEISTYPSNLGIIIIVVDKTEEEETKRLSAVGQTAGMVGHDIRNPLQAITGDLFLIEQELNTSPQCRSEDISEGIKAINDNIGYINKIVSDLQDYTRTIKPIITAINLRNLITSTLGSREIPSEIELLVDVKGDILMKTDVTFVKRIMNNLVNNAIQAMPKGGKLSVEAFEKQGKAIIIVQDTGIGISDKDKPNLFKPLFTTKAKGQGLGLSVVKRFIEALFGTITFESEEGKGTKFIVSLPLEVND